MTEMRRKVLTVFFWFLVAAVVPLSGHMATAVADTTAADVSARPHSGPWVVYTGRDGPGKGKHVVLVSGDEEYRSEEALPQLGKILAIRHGFTCTVLFAIDPETGTIDPDNTHNIPGLKALQSADLMIIATRFRDLPDQQMKYVAEYIDAGKPVIGMRAAVVAFRLTSPTYERFSCRSRTVEGGFGRQILGQTWISHHGRHGHESTRGVIVPGAEDHPIVRGCDDVWGPTDVYTVRSDLRNDSNVLMLGQVLAGMHPTDKPVAGAKDVLQDHENSALAEGSPQPAPRSGTPSKNHPMMPIAWTRSYRGANGQVGRVFTTTMGAATDLESEGFRRLLVNAAYWCVGLEKKIPQKSNVATVGTYKPLPFGFGKYKKGVRPSDYALDQTTVADANYIARFQQRFEPVDPVPTMAQYATAARYDDLFLGESLTQALKRVAESANDRGGLAWALAYRMMSFNAMYRCTGDVKYLRALLQCAGAALACTDDQRGKKLWTGAEAKAWGCDLYAHRGRAVFAVHTGMIAYPILDGLALIRREPAFHASLGDRYQKILDTTREIISYHDRQWRDGPESGAGHYIGLDQEEVCENRPLPGNRLSAMGRALWAAWKVAGSTADRDRALAIAVYIKHRLTPDPEGACYWPYWLPEEPVQGPKSRTAIKGEDTSHAALTASLPMLLAAEGEVFTASDMQRMGKMVTHGFGRLGHGVLLGNITGTPNSNPSLVGAPSRYLPLSGCVPEVYPTIAEFYLRYRPVPDPGAIPLLIEARPTNRPVPVPAQ